MEVFRFCESPALPSSLIKRAKAGICGNFYDTDVLPDMDALVSFFIKEGNAKKEG